MNLIRKVAVIGINGSLAPYIINNLLKAGFEITLITHSPEKTKEKYPQLAVQAPDYESIDSIASKLKGHDAVVDITARDDIGLQKKLIDSAILGKVPFYVPSAYGYPMDEKKRADYPPMDNKFRVYDHLIAEAKQGKIAWAGIDTWMLFDLMIGLGFAFNTTGVEPTLLWDDGNIPATGVLIDDAAKATANLLKIAHQKQYQNRFYNIKSLEYTQNKILRVAKTEFPDRPWPTTNVDIENWFKESKEAYANGDHSPNVMYGFIMRYSLKYTYDDMKHVENDLLGVKMLDDEGFKKVVVDLINK